MLLRESFEFNAPGSELLLLKNGHSILSFPNQPIRFLLCSGPDLFSMAARHRYDVIRSPFMTVAECDRVVRVHNTASSRPCERRPRLSNVVATCLAVNGCDDTSSVEHAAAGVSCGDEVVV